MSQNTKLFFYKTHSPTLKRHLKWCLFSLLMKKKQTFYCEKMNHISGTIPFAKENYLSNLSCIFCMLVCLVGVHVNRFLNETHLFSLDNVCAAPWAHKVLSKCSVLFSPILSHDLYYYLTPDIAYYQER